MAITGRAQANRRRDDAPGARLGSPKRTPAPAFDRAPGRGRPVRDRSFLDEPPDQPSEVRQIRRYKVRSRRAPRVRIKPSLTAQDLVHGLSLRGKTALVTDVDTPLGFEIMRVLCLRGARVFATGTSLDRAKAACDMIAGKAQPFACNFSELSSVSDCAAEIGGRAVPLDMVICQAVDLGGRRPRRAAEAVAATGESVRRETRYTTRDVGCFLLIDRLLDMVKQAAEARIVILTGRQEPWGSLSGGARFDDFLKQRESRGAPAVMSGVDPAPFLLTAELARRLQDSSVTVNSVAPGLRTRGPATKKGMGVKVKAVLGKLARKLGRQETSAVALAAAAPVYVATNPRLKGVSGYYFDKFNAKRLNRPAGDRVLAGRLWNRYCELTKYY